MKIGRIILGTALLSVLAWAGSAVAQDQNGRYYNEGNAPPISPSTSEFLQQAAIGNMAEVRMGMIARNRASDPAVRDFGDQMVQDHSQAIDQLRDMARDKGWPLPGTLDTEHRMAIQRLRSRSGDDFDRLYMRMMVRDHQEDVAMFRDYARNGDDPDLRAWARETLPTLYRHRQLAWQTSSTMNAGWRR
jgi:putative membrane protein